MIPLIGQLDSFGRLRRNFSEGFVCEDHDLVDDHHGCQHDEAQGVGFLHLNVGDPM